MEGLDKIDFSINFNDLPENFEQLSKKLTPEERKSLEELPELDLELTLSEDNPTLLIRKLFGKQDEYRLALTHEEMVDAVFRSPWFTKGLSEGQRKMVGQFVKTIVPENTKYYTRDELVTTARNMLLIISP
eukprot:TRINITY_DN7951_c0_g2_i16.p1 TRINITY_DN7951_c0_g2~~TRINITY_DN7951_c0_g2_i16.p1  ORF type:complete len:131 (+),score=37.91 TRINITY_DN7951_c0_g2_i16:139-531(+)